MKFKLTEGKLAITDIQDDDRGRLARIDIAILKRIGSMRCDAIVNRETAYHFDPERTEGVRTALIDFMVEV